MPYYKMTKLKFLFIKRNVRVCDKIETLDYSTIG